jgi:metal-dependent amidase/aminoacylase/carboxypeptidase family protein
MKEIMTHIDQIAKSSASIYGCTVSISYYDYYPAVVNTPEETNHFIRVAS